MRSYIYFILTLVIIFTGGAKDSVSPEETTMIRLAATENQINNYREIYFLALDKDQFNIDDIWSYDKNDADWYIDPNFISNYITIDDFFFQVTDYNVFNKSPGKYYYLCVAYGYVQRSTFEILKGKNTICCGRGEHCDFE